MSRRLLIVWALLSNSGWSDQTSPSTITGTVVSADAAASPISRAVVTVIGRGVAQGRSVITDNDGRFAFDDLPAGRVMVTASKPAYLTVSFGATSPEREGTPIVLATGRRVDITIALPRGGVISGQIRSPSGEPLPDVPVWVMRSKSQGGWPSAPIPPVAVTDVQGTYRVFGLVEGDYLVAAMPRAVSLGPIIGADPRAIDQALAQLRAGASGAQGSDLAKVAQPLLNYAPIYYPGTPAYWDASLVSVTPGTERTQISFGVSLVQTATIQGTARSSVGELGSVELKLLADRPAFPVDNSTGPTEVRTEARDGFRYLGVPPGRYRVLARARTSGTATRGQLPAPFSLWALQEVQVLGSGNEVVTVDLLLQPMLDVRGRVEFKSSVLRLPELGRVRVHLTESQTLGTLIVPGNAERPTKSTSAVVGPDGTFRIDGLMPGRYNLTVEVPSQSWVLQSAILGQTDYLDTGVLLDRTSLDGVVVTFTDEQSSLTGSLSDLNGALTDDLWVVVFAADSNQRSSARRLRTVRPATDGSYQLEQLPPGEYLVAVLRDLRSSMTVDNLKALASLATPVTIRAGERRVLNLSVRQ